MLVLWPHTLRHYAAHSHIAEQSQTEPHNTLTLPPVCLTPRARALNGTSLNYQLIQCAHERIERESEIISKSFVVHSSEKDAWHCRSRRCFVKESSPRSPPVFPHAFIFSACTLYDVVCLRHATATAGL